MAAHGKHHRPLLRAEGLVVRTLRAWVVRLLALFRGSKDDDFDAELESHLQLHIDDNLRAGMSPSAARRHALIRLGGVQAVQERQRDRRGLPALQHLGRDLHYAARALRRQPTFASVTVLTLALGIGANTSIFTLVNAVLLNPLPYPDPDRLALVWGTDLSDGRREISISYPDFEAWQQQARSFDGMAAFTSRAVTLGGADQLELVPAVQTTVQFFEVLGIEPIAGRTFVADDAGPDAEAVAVLSDAAWRRLFGEAPDAIGTSITVNNRPHTVIGIVAASMHIIPTEQEQVYSLLPPETDRQHGYLRTVARLRPGVSFASAQSEMDVIAGQIATEFPRSNARTGAHVVRLSEAGGTPVRDALLILLVLVGVVLLIACTNVANLLMARNAARHHELALRVSLGASRGRILQQLFAEALLLALCGGVAGLIVAQMATDVLLTLLDGAVPVPRLERARLDTTVLSFAAGVSIVTGVLFGVIPAIVAAPRRISRVTESGRSIAGNRGARRTRATLVVLETALALVLLAAAAMLGRSFVELRGTPPGFAADDVIAVGLRLPTAVSPGAPREAFFEQLRARLERLPHVASAGVVSNLPLAGSSDSLQFRVPDRPAAKPMSANFNIATPGYFETMRIPIVAGREFTTDDSSTAPQVIVVNQTAARRLWPSENPLGRHIVLTGQTIPLTVVGISGDVRQSSLGAESRPEVYLNGLQPGPDWASFALVVRSRPGAGSVIADVRGAVRHVNRDVAIAKIAPMADVIAGSVAQPRIYTALIGAFAMLAVLLAAVGLYGVMSYSVAQQTRELGIRLALGSTPSGIVLSVLRQGTLLTLIGSVVGSGGAYLATRAMAKLLPGARGEDPAIVAAVAGLMVVIGAAASFVPARRASQVDPLVALRVE
jgi:putative ABC transport system permease protein